MPVLIAYINIYIFILITIILIFCLIFLSSKKHLQELQQKLVDSQYAAQAALKRNEELQSRCDELSSHCESERKAK